MPTAAPKGIRPPGGSRRGVPNKLTADLRAMILRALDGVGGVGYLERQAEKNPVAFMTLVGKVLPLKVGGEPNKPLVVRVVHIYNTERHLLYVACTRARDYLLVTAVKPGSEFLQDLTQ